MPKFLVDTEKFVFLQIPQGKSYITAPEKRLPQAPQKGETCWYSIINFLRPRYGKEIDKLEPNLNTDNAQLNSDIDQLISERAYEKKLSDYRKKTTYHEVLRVYANIYIENLAKTSTAIDKQWAKNRIYTIRHSNLIQDSSNPGSITELLQQKIAAENNHNVDNLTNLKILQDSDEKQLELDMLTEFIDQDDYPILNEDFTKKAYHKRLVALSKTTLSDLKLKAPAQPDVNDKTVKQLLAEEMQYRAIIIDSITKHYKLPFSSWNPTNGIRDLIKNIKQHGAHAVGGTLGFAHFRNKAELLGEIHSHSILELADADYKPISMPHVILIVGAEIVTTYNDSGEAVAEKAYVYLIDPALNTGSILKISYERLCDGLLDVAGKPFNKDSPSHFPYAACPNESEINKAIARYQKVKTHLGKLNLFENSKKVQEPSQPHSDRTLQAKK